MPYQWRQLTPRMLARHVVAVLDLGQAPGAIPPGHDPRVEALVAALSGSPWRSLTVGGLVDRLLDAFDTWHARDVCLDLELAWLLRDDGA